MSARVLGIDIGSHGAIAMVTPTGDLDGVVDMPILRDGPKGRPNVSAGRLCEPTTTPFNASANRLLAAFLSAPRPLEASQFAARRELAVLKRFRQFTASVGARSTGSELSPVD